LVTLTAYALNQEKQSNLSNRHTNWDYFRRITFLLKPKKTLKQRSSASAIQFNGQAGMQTSEHKETFKVYDCPILIKQEVEEKRRLIRNWHRLRTPKSNRQIVTQELKELLNNDRNDYIQTFLQGFTPTESTDNSLWKAPMKLKQVKKTSLLRTSKGTWERSNVENAHAFAEHIAEVFNHMPQKLNPKRKQHLRVFHL
jgi:hypothetical protein